ncbi:IS3 family transposase [Streptomyces sp. NPDC002928]|uniref:IS3 family transposase n=1 Tax=Streptomyces sp. NPDC002928 TaxID=3154440 RepID=UPI0033B5E943
MVAAYTPHRSRTQAATPAPARSGPFRLSEHPSALVRPVGGPRQGPPTGHCGRPDRFAAGTRVKEGRRQRTSPRGCGFPFVLGSFRTADDSGGTYGSPKNWIRLVRQGWRVSVNTIAKIMAELGLVARKVCRRRGLTRPGKRSAALDFVRRDFTAEAPNLVWCGDMTEIETGQDKLYLATVIDLFSRRLLGYAMGGTSRCRTGRRCLAHGRRDPRRRGPWRDLLQRSRQRGTPRGSSAAPAAGWALSRPWSGRLVLRLFRRGGLSGVMTDPSGVLVVDLSVAPTAGSFRAVGCAGNDRMGSCSTREARLSRGAAVPAAYVGPPQACRCSCRAPGRNGDTSRACAAATVRDPASPHPVLRMAPELLALIPSGMHVLI